jgi:hypothetical protein
VPVAILAGHVELDEVMMGVLDGRDREATLVECGNQPLDESGFSTALMANDGDDTHAADPPSFSQVRLAPSSFSHSPGGEARAAADQTHAKTATDRGMTSEQTDGDAHREQHHRGAAADA